LLFKHDVECQELIMEALKYHLLPERRLAMQSFRTKPRKSTVGVLYAVGGMDCTKGNCCFTMCRYCKACCALWQFCVTTCLLSHSWSVSKRLNKVAIFAT